MSALFEPFQAACSPGMTAVLGVLSESSHDVQIIVSGKHPGAAFLNDSLQKIINVPCSGSLVDREKQKLEGLCEMP